MNKIFELSKNIRLILVIFTVLLLAFYGLEAQAAKKDNYCSQTTKKAHKACGYEAKEDSKIDFAKCINVADDAARQQCKNDVSEAFAEAKLFCGEVRTARREVCNLIGEGRYDPVLDPAYFVDPLTIGTSTLANPFMPLIPGLVKIFESEDETITVTVTDRTRKIMGITAIVVTDIVEEDGELVEVTDDWFAQDIYGNVWYMGEHVLNYEDGMIVDLEGSFEAGVDYARAGILMKAFPEVGDVYRQEWFLDEAEDMAEVIDLNASESVDVASCFGNCLQTLEWSALEPDVYEYKFFVAGIGVIVAYHIDEPDNREELVEIIFP